MNSNQRMILDVDGAELIATVDVTETRAEMSFRIGDGDELTFDLRNGEVRAELYALSTLINNGAHRGVVRTKNLNDAAVARETNNLVGAAVEGER